MSCKKTMSDEEMYTVVGGTNQNDAVEFEGIIIESLPNNVFKVELEDGRIVEAVISDKLRMYFIRILTGDRVTVQFQGSDSARGEIINRLKK